MKQADIIFKNINNENRVYIVLFHKDKILVQHMVEDEISYFQQLTDEELIDKLNYYLPKIRDYLFSWLIILKIRRQKQPPWCLYCILSHSWS